MSNCSGAASFRILCERGGTGCSKSHIKGAVFRKEMAEIRNFAMLSTSVAQFFVTSDLDGVSGRWVESATMANAVTSPPSTSLLGWLALCLTAGLGPTKSRKLLEHFGSVERIFQAPLTELEATGI